MSRKIAMLFPYAPSYREAIYKLMDVSLNIDWYFCSNDERNLKLLDYSLLNHCDQSMHEYKVIGPITYYQGIRKLNLRQYDVIICPGVIRSISDWWLLHKFGKGMRNTKIYLWTHGWYGKETFIQKVIKKIFFKHVDGFLLYGDYAKKQMLSQGFKEEKLFVIKNSLDYDKQLQLRKKIRQTDIYKNHFKNEFPTLIFVGRLTKVKKLEQIIKSVALLKQLGENYNIVFVGDGEMRNELESETVHCDIRDNVWFYGECFDETTNAELIYNASLCVAPGNIGLTAIHVLMFGCPAISHNNFSMQMPEFEAIIPGVTGDFFKYDDVNDLAQCISKWHRANHDCRDIVRLACYNEVDSNWTPHYQINVLKSILD